MNIEALSKMDSIFKMQRQLSSFGNLVDKLYPLRNVQALKINNSIPESMKHLSEIQNHFKQLTMPLQHVTVSEKLLSPPVMQAFESLSKVQSVFTTGSNLDAITNFLNIRNSLINKFDQGLYNKAIKQVGNSPFINAIETHAIFNRGFNNSFFANFLDDVDYAIENIDDDEFDSVFSDIISQLNKHLLGLKELTTGNTPNITLKNILDFLIYIITIYTFYSSIISSKETEAYRTQNMAKLEVVEHKISKNKEELGDLKKNQSMFQQNLTESIELSQRIFEKISEDDNHSYRIVTRTNKLRVKPKFKSFAITSVYPNQQIQVIKKKGDWVYIVFTDLITGVPKTGWFPKKYTIQQK